MTIRSLRSASQFALVIADLMMTGILRSEIVFEGPMESAVLGTNRLVRIYLPPSYRDSTDRRYPVLYLHDGQNVFSTAGTNAGFGWGNWEVDRTVDRLCAEKRLQEIIVVGVDNTAQRYVEYRGPARPASGEELSRLEPKSAFLGDDSPFRKYARFLIEELKPKIDREYRTLTEASNTAVMGSSMGGICSLALAWEYPKIFGQAASLSGAFQVEQGSFLETLKVYRAYRGMPKPFRVYLDSGTTDFTGGDDGRKQTGAVAAELRRIGWRDSFDLEHYVDMQPLLPEELEKVGLRRDKWPEAQRSQHNEFYWRLRVWRPLVFLFGAKL